jgi:uncharacterized tellurite resistance protein B-like protein
MVPAIRRFLAEIMGAPEPRPFTEDDLRLSAAALLFHVIAVDDNVTPDERARLHDLLKERFALGDRDTDALIAAAKTADDEAVDLYGFTSVLKRHLDERERERIIEMMWQLVFADGEVHEFEENVLWRVAELMGVSSQVRIRLKQSARATAAGQ